MKVTDEELAGIASNLKALPPEQFDNGLRIVLDTILGAAAAEIVKHAKRAKDAETLLEAVTLHRGVKA